MADLGLYALRLALFASALGLAVGVFAGMTRRDDWTQVAERSVLVVGAALSVAMGALFWSLATNDFGIAYVAQHSARTMPLHYRLGALWGGQAGSLLLGGWMLSMYGAVAVLGNRRQNRRLMPWVTSTRSIGTDLPKRAARFAAIASRRAKRPRLSV